MGRARGDKICHRGDVDGPQRRAARARGRNRTKTFAGEWFSGWSPAAADTRKGHMPGKPIARGAGLLQATQHARRMNEGRMPGSAGETLATQGRRPFPHNPQDTARQENPCRSPAPRAMSLPRKAETHATTTRRTPPPRKTPVGARPSGRCRCQEVCGRRAQEGRRWSGRWRYHRGWTIAARPGGADCKGSKKNHENSRMRYHSFTNPATR